MAQPTAQTDRDLNSISEARSLARRAKEAAPALAEFSQEQIDAMVDAMDLTVAVAALPARELSAAAASDASAAIRGRVEAARSRQMSRDAILNARLQGRLLRARTPLERDARRIFETALNRLALTARGHDRVLRVARTIADLEGCDGIQAHHVGEALQFRGE